MSKITWVYYINYYLLQWLFIRLGRIVENKKTIGFRILYGIIPMTGWTSDYKVIKYNNLNLDK